MLNELKQNVAKMFSLMERMDKHMTSMEAEYNKDAYINEAVNVQPQNQANAQKKKLYPVAWFNIKEDDNAMKKIVNVYIRPLYNEDISAIKRTMPYSLDDKCQPYKDSVGRGITFFRFIPMREVKHRKQNAQAQVPDNQDNAAQAQQTAQQAQANDMSSEDMLMNAFGLNEGMIRESDDLLDMLLAAAGGDDNTGTTNDAAQTSAPVQNNAAGEAVEDDDMMKWLKSYYMGIVDIIAKDSRYDEKAIEELKDLFSIHRLYKGTPTDKEKIYVEKSSEQLKKEIGDAIANGQWADVLKANINPLNLDSYIFGNVLTARNQNAVMNMARQYGIQPGDPNYPTLVMGPTMWYKYMKRNVVDNPQVRYPLVTPMVDVHGSSAGKMGTEGHYKSFGDSIRGFTTFIGYDISDTEPADPNDTTDYINGALPGIINNLTGELNQAAIDYKTTLLAAKEAGLTDEQKEMLKDVETIDGQARVFNRALLTYAEQYNINVKLIDLDETGGGVNEYVQNIMAITNNAVVNMGYANQDIVMPMTIISAFGIACYTVGSDEVLRIGRSKYAFKQSFDASWKTYADSIISIISGMINFVFKYLNAVYKPLRDKAGAPDGNAPIVIPDINGEEQSAPLNENKNNYFSVIEEILNNL